MVRIAIQFDINLSTQLQLYKGPKKTNWNGYRSQHIGTQVILIQAYIGYDILDPPIAPLDVCKEAMTLSSEPTRMCLFLIDESNIA